MIIFCGVDHTFILKHSGELFAFGDNSYGQLGSGDYVDRNKPTLLMIDNNIKSINKHKVKIIWNPQKYIYLSEQKKKEIKTFLLVCYYYKKIHNINMVKYMKHNIISLSF